MELINNECPGNLMQALLEIRNSGRCNLIDRVCVIETLYEFGYAEVASWLDRHKENYDEIVLDDFSKYFSEWLNTHFPYARESLAQRVARETGLELVDD
jgi:hypothetical protein